MFEPRAFAERSSAQEQLMDALQHRDLATFETLLSDPEVDPDHWYGKPHWATCLSLACKEQGCEGFVLALLRAGAGTHKSTNMRASDRKDSQEKTLKNFTVDPTILKATVDLALSKVEDSPTAEKIKTDEVLECVRQTCHMVEEYRERVQQDVRECLKQVERCEQRLVSIEQAQKRTNAMLSQVLDLLPKPQLQRNN